MRDAQLAARPNCVDEQPLGARIAHQEVAPRAETRSTQRNIVQATCFTLIVVGSSRRPAFVTDEHDLRFASESALAVGTWVLVLLSRRNDRSNAHGFAFVVPARARGDIRCISSSRAGATESKDK